MPTQILIINIAMHLKSSVFANRWERLLLLYNFRKILKESQEEIIRLNSTQRISSLG